MNVKRTIKKIAALGAGATMVGATIMGAAAYNLADYPDPFIMDGVFDGKIVVGESAATTDVLGAIDIAASLQRGAVSTVAVDIPGLAGEVNLEGDAFKIETTSDLLEIREPLGAVVDTLTESELQALYGGQIVTDEGSTDYYQYLRFGEVAGDALQMIGANYVEDENDLLGDFLVIDDDEPFMEWELEFSEGLESETAGGELEDLEDEVWNIFGTEYTIVSSSITTSGSSSGSLTLTLMAGDVSTTMREGETKTFTLNGVEYEVTLIFVSDPSTTGATNEAKFMVNGEVTDSLSDGDTDTLSGGVQLGVRDLLVNSRDGVVEFFLGANKIEFVDTTTLTESFNGDVEINNENIEDASLAMLGSFVTTDNSTYEITNIKYRLTADANVGSTIYVPPGMGVREFLDEPEGLLSTSFDLLYEGLTDVAVNPISINAQSDHSYEASLTNLRGKTYDWELVTNQQGTFQWGDDDDDFWFTEPGVAGTTNDEIAANITVNSTVLDCWIGDDDYFVLSEGDDTTNSEKDDSAIMRYEDIDTSDRVLQFTDESSGETREVSYTTHSDADILGIATNFVVEGHTYTVWVCDSSAYPLAIDLDGDNTLAAGRATFTVRGGGVIDFDSSDQSAPGLAVTTAGAEAPDRADVGAASITMNLATPGNQFDDSSAGGDSLNWTITNQTSNEVDLSVPSTNAYTGPLTDAGDSNGFEFDNFDMFNDDGDDDYDRGMSDYGALIEAYDPSGSNDAGELDIHYPEGQRGAQVFVVAGSTTRSESAGGVSSQQVNPISVGLAILDSDAPALGSENMISVGGSCVNTVSAAIMGNPADCTEGFTPGKGMIKSDERGGSVAVMVAGYSAEDTLGTSYVLANYEDYALSGSEVEVVTTSLSDLTVQSIA